jgi:ABC-type uncharacterized transport system involved in gliding motility auxiliary subunit
MAGAAMRRSVPLVLGTLGLLGCAAVVLALTYRHNVRVDLTAQGAYTLSPHTRKILVALDQDVRATVFVRAEDPRTPGIKDLLWRMRQETPRLSYELVDLNRSPARARAYGVDRYGALVFESGGKRRDIGNPDEGLMTSAILAVTRARARVVYFVTGHGEPAPTDGDRKSGASIAARALADELFTVRELSLLGTGGVPADASVVVIAGSRREYLPEERAHLEAYLARGGDLLLLLEPDGPASLAALAAARGVVPLAEVVVDPSERLASGEGLTFKVAELDQRFLVSRTLEAAPVFSQARPLRVAETGAPVVAFLRTSPASYGVAAERPAAGGARGSGGPLTVGAAVLATAGVGGPPTGRLIVHGDADFATNALIEYLGNKDLLVNSVNWLARDEFLIATRAQEKAAGREQFFVTEAQGEMAFWLAAVVQPGLFLALGAAVLIRRRLR